MIIDSAGQGGWALGKDCRHRAADETPGLAEHTAPQRGIQRGIVDLADEFRKLLCLIHGHPRRRTLESRSSIWLPANYPDPLEPFPFRSNRNGAPDSLFDPLS